MKPYTKIRTATAMELVNAANTAIYNLVHHPENIPWFYQHPRVLDLSAGLAKLSNAVGIMWGEADQVVPLSVGINMAKIIPNCRYISYPGKQHDYAITYPDFTYQELLKLIGRSN